MNKKTILKNNKQAQNYSIPINGSLGILALGDKGLRAWRKVRDIQIIKENK